MRRAANSLVIIGIVAICSAVAQSGDTNQLTEISVEQARELIQQHPYYLSLNGLTELPPEVADVDVDHVAFRIEVHVPDLLEQGRAPDHLFGVEQEVLEQLELLGRQIAF